MLNKLARRGARDGGRFAIVASRYNARYVDALVRAARRELMAGGAQAVEALSMRARALEDGAVGQSVRFLNTSSNRTIAATVTGPGSARVETP